MKNKIIISHPSGNENTRAAVNGFYNASALDTFITSVAVFKNAWYYHFLHFSILREFKKRTFSSALQHKTKVFPLKEMGRMIAKTLNIKTMSKQNKGIFCSYEVCKYIDVKTANYLHRHKETTDAVYCYEDIALETFREAKKYGIKCFYDLPIGHWRYMRTLLQNELQKNKEWAITLGGLDDPNSKLKQKDEELRLADKIYVASTFTKKSLELYPSKLANIEVIPYGFPPANMQRVFRDLSNRKIKLLYVGGLSQRKGISYMFEALNGLEDFELTIISGSTNIDECPILKRSLTKHHFLGALPHDKVLKEMANNDILIFPSLFEGFGLVITEAMSQGTPVITTERTCGPDVITDGKDGWIVKAGESTSIREKLLYLSRNREKITKAGRNCLITAANRPWKKYEQELSNSVINYLNECD